jgi:beta-lactam-binding protein with PASTA domain
MTKKEFFDRYIGRYLLYNLIGMAVAVVLLCLGVGYGLDLYTHHGEGIVVPDLVGKGVENSRRQLEALGLSIVVTDSGYNKKMPANTVLAQTPASGQKVKEGRVIYVTINSPSSPTFTIPDIIDNSSVREAEAKLTAIGFRLEPAVMVDGERDWVYGIVSNGRRVSNGDRVPIDQPLRLLVGRGASDDMDDLEFVEEPGYGEATEDEGAESTAETPAAN